MKKCTKCGIEKDESEFHKHARRKDGYNNVCKICRKLYDNKEIKREYDKQWYINHKKEKNEYSKEWEIENKEYRRKYKRERRKNNLCIKLRSNVSRAILANLKKEYGSKRGSSILKYLSYSIEELKQHLENQFEDWMSWENYGGNALEERKTWWIDHIIPQSLLPYDSMEHPNFQKCWALENLRPLEKKQNISKGNKINDKSC
jgi:hypothetical protein